MFIVLLQLLFIWSASAQVMDPQKMDLDSFGSDYLPVIRAYESVVDFSETMVEQISSPHGTMELTVQEESDLTKITYDSSFSKTIVQQNGLPILTIELSGYRNYQIVWLNEDLLQITNWPGRCVELHTIYSVLDQHEIYQVGFNHCGAGKPD